MFGTGPVCQSMLPAASASAPAVLPERDRDRRFFTAGSPPQCFGLAVSVNACALKLESVNGPVPTGFSMTLVAGSTLFQMCSGTIGVRASTDGPLTNAGWFQVKVTCESSALATVPSKPPVLRDGVLSSMLNVKTTSSAVNGLPSDHVTFLRRVTSSWVPASFQAYLVPSSGFGSLLFTLVMKNRPS